MPTVFSHAVVPVAAAIALGRERVPKWLLVAGVLFSVLPDLDVLAFRLGISYANEFGHRGFSHSLLFAIMVAMLGAVVCRTFCLSAAKSFLFLFVAIASHGVLDAFTNGGLGIAFFWPFTGERFFAPYQPIEVAPFGLARFLSARGVAVMKSEIIWVWLPFLSMALVASVALRKKSPAIPATAEEQ